MSSEDPRREGIFQHPCDVGRKPRYAGCDLAYRVLRLRSCFASRSSHSAQDDRAHTAIQALAPATHSACREPP